MAKLTIAGVKTLVNTVVDANKISQESPFTPTYDSITGLLIKVGKQFQLDSNFEDRLPEFEGGALGIGGTTVEEYFTDLVLPVADDPNGTTNMAPKRLTYQDVVYSYELDQKVIPVTVDKNKIEHAMIGQEEFSTLIATILKRMYDSSAVYRYFLKLQLLAKYADMIAATANTQAAMKVTIAKPVDTATGEAFAKAVKNKVEEMTLISESLNLAGVPAVSNEGDLKLYVIKGVKSVMDIDVEAGAFNVGKVQIPVEFKTVEEFPNLVNTKVYAILVDTRGIRTFTANEDTDDDKNGQGGFTNFYLKYRPTMHLSKVVNACVFLDV